MSIILKASSLTPYRIRAAIRKLGINRLLDPFISKTDAELIYQLNWVKEFKSKKGKAKDYWEKYLYLKEIKRITKNRTSSKVLDVGCGISTVLHFLEGERFGIDPLAEKYKEKYSYPKGIKIIEGVGESLPFKKNYFSEVWCTNVLDHTDSPKRVVGEIERVLKPHGFFILTVHFFDRSFKRDPAHPHTFTRKYINELLCNKFLLVKEFVSPAVGIYEYVVNGKTNSEERELIMIMRKC